MKSRENLLVPLVGGLGNQLFQLSFGVYLEKTTQRSVQFKFVDLSPRITNVSQRQFAIQRLLQDGEQSTTSRTRVAILWLQALINDSIWISESDNTIDVARRIKPSTRVVSGYFQNFNYVNSVRDEIRGRLEPLLVATPKFSNPYIAIHLRFGDYYSSSRTRKFHGLTTPEYYKSALLAVRRVMECRNVCVVSDDCSKASDYVELWKLQRDFDFKVLEGSNVWEDLGVLASACAVVCSNSSFSWWGGYLAAHRQQATVIVPKPWFADPARDTTSLIPPEWTEVPREYLC